HGRRVVALFGRQVGVQQQAGHADHGVHRGPDLVAHRARNADLAWVAAIASSRACSMTRLAAPSATAISAISAGPRRSARSRASRTPKSSSGSPVATRRAPAVIIAIGPVT